MTETEWLQTDDWEDMLFFLDGRISDRKARLIACGLCHQAWHLLINERYRKVVRMAELFADRLIARKKLVRAQQQTRLSNVDKSIGLAAYHSAGKNAWGAALEVACYLSQVEKAVTSIQVCNVLREIAGNPFEDVRLLSGLSKWNYDAILNVANSIYNGDYTSHVDVSLYSVLANMLENAGCIDTLLLSHCRDSIAHLRGCWVIDILLGKS